MNNEERLMKIIELQRKEILQMKEALAGLVPNGDENLGDLIALPKWVESVKSGLFIDYDGMGSFATATHHAGEAYEWVYPSDVEQGKFHPPAWATHILWYNR